MPRSSVAISFVCVCAGREVPRFCCDVRYVFGVLRCREHASLSSCDREARAPARLAQHGIHAMADPRPADAYIYIVVRRWRAVAANQ